MRYLIEVEAEKVTAMQVVLINGAKMVARVGEYICTIPNTSPMVKYICDATTFAATHDSITSKSQVANANTCPDCGETMVIGAMHVCPTGAGYSDANRTWGPGQTDANEPPVIK
jgi:hypothetical protein